MAVNRQRRVKAKAAILAAQQEALAIFEKWLRAVDDRSGGAVVPALAEEIRFTRRLRVAEERMRLALDEEQPCPTRHPAYYGAAARSVGVPEMWVEDAVQDIMLAVWLEGNDGSLVVRRRAVDAARRYGPRMRSGTERVHVLLDEAEQLAAPDDTAVADTVMDVQRALAIMTPAQRRHIERAANGVFSNASLRQRADLARELLRKLCAA